MSAPLTADQQRIYSAAVDLFNALAQVYPGSDGDLVDSARRTAAQVMLSAHQIATYDSSVVVVPIAVVEPDDTQVIRLDDTQVIKSAPAPRRVPSPDRAYDVDMATLRGLIDKGA